MLPTILQPDPSDAQISLHERLETLRLWACQNGAAPGLNRIAVALYDSENNRVQTHAYASSIPSPLDHYGCSLSESNTLWEMAVTTSDQVIEDYEQHPGGAHHTQSIRASGIRSAWVIPFYDGGHFRGFLFFNAATPDYFTEERRQAMAVFVALVEQVVLHSLRKSYLLRATARIAMAFGNVRDDETGAHLARMSAYTRLIASNLAFDWQLPDEFVHMIGEFAPAHDLGKVGVGDAILQKPGRLTAEEFEQMKLHVDCGLEMLDRMLTELQLVDDRRATVLRNIIAYHHERLDGSGYPEGARGSEIPLEGRIIAVADVFDALTSKRPYKRAWSLEEAEAELRAEVARGRLCAQSVEALFRCPGEIARIQRFHNDTAHAINVPIEA